MHQVSCPGPVARWGGINHLRGIRSDFRAFSHALHQRYGDIVSYRILGQSVYQFATPDLAHEVLVEKAKLLHKPDNQKRAFGRIIGNNLFTSDGHDWVVRRRLLAPLFVLPVVARYGDIIARQARDAFQDLPDGEVDISRLAGRIALLSVGELLFGTVINDIAEMFLEVAAQLQSVVTRQIQSPLLLPLWIPTRDNRTVKSSLRFFHSFIRPLIAQRHRTPGEFHDLLAALLSATSSEDGKQLNDREAVDEALTILLAGSDTMSAAISWSAYLLAKYPEVQQQLHDELSVVSPNEVVDGAAGPAFQNAERIFQESMRLYPPAVAIARQAAESLEIGGVPVPRGSLVFVSVYSMHHDARWFPNPELFQPERFGPENSSDRLDRAFLPFGVGPRACIGRHLAMIEGPQVLAELVGQFSLCLLEQSMAPELETQLSLHPRGGLRLLLSRH